MSGPKDKRDPNAGEPSDQKPKRKKQKLIRLDDLIPKKDVKGGGGQHLFGVTDTESDEKEK